VLGFFTPTLTGILHTDPDAAGADGLESPQPAEERNRINRHQEVLAAIEENLLQLQSAFTALNACRTAEEQLADEVRKAESDLT
jgi:hypothetical protein